jgi:hypothetical protein
MVNLLLLKLIQAMPNTPEIVVLHGVVLRSIAAHPRGNMSANGAFTVL